ncbi:MAG: hypothetical protein HY697_00410 [Deltaproteobacteria bacterium]|nr:hypothetical protein [Deltaproteobacteria bacterium]
MAKGFRYITEEVIPVPGRGIVVQGKVAEGSVSVGEEVGFLGMDGAWNRGLVTGIEVSRQLVEEATPGQQASLLLEGVRKEQIGQGTVLLEVPAAPAAPVHPPPSSSSSSSTAPADYGLPPSFPDRAIHPPSSLWRTVFFIILGVLIILALWRLQGR